MNWETDELIDQIINDPYAEERLVVIYEKLSLYWSKDLRERITRDYGHVLSASDLRKVQWKRVRAYFQESYRERQEYEKSHG